MATHVNKPAPILRSDATTPLAELAISVSSRAEKIAPVVEALMRFMKPVLDRYSDDSAFELELSLNEAVANAIVHGNRENPEKRVVVHCRYTMDGEVWIAVRDEGAGFDPAALPDPTAPDNLLLTHGRGIHMMRGLMDEVVFENGGTLVSMRKLLRKAAA